MIQIRPVSDLRNKFTEIEQTVSDGQPVFLTKNGYGTMVVMSIDAYSHLIDRVELALDKADDLSTKDKQRMSHEDVFSDLRGILHGKI